MAKHQDLSSPYAIHPFAYSSNADPANDGSIDTTPYKGWLNTGNSNLLKVRNAADTAWESVSVDGAATAPAFGSNSTTVTTYNDNDGTLAAAQAHHHIGVASLAHSSNTYSGPITLTTPGNTVGITSPGTGQLAFTATASGGGSATPPDGYENVLTAPVTIVNANTFYVACSLSLPAGDWYLHGEGDVSTVIGSGFLTIQLYDSTAATVLRARGAYGSGGAGGSASLSVQDRVTLSETSTIQLRFASIRGSSDSVILDTAAANGTADKCTSLVAIKVTAV